MGSKYPMTQGRVLPIIIGTTCFASCHYPYIVPPRLKSIAHVIAANLIFSVKIIVAYNARSNVTG